MSWARRLTWGGLAIVLVGGLVWALWPQPTPVDMAIATRGTLQVTIAGDGITRVREPFAITAPTTGTVERSPVQVGDTVVAGQSVVAVILPAEPALMDARTRAQAEAAVTEAEAAVQVAETNLRRVISDLSHVRTELDRAQALAATGAISQRALENAQQAFTQATQALAGARSERELRQAGLARARAQLLGPDAVAPGDGRLVLKAPHSGTVLSIADASARLVQAGAPLLTIGDLNDLEVEVDLLSPDAVKVSPGAAAFIDRWGGDGILGARVRRIDPAAFTRVSALGIEEQRVRLLLDFTGPAEARRGLGDRYRVFVRIVTWEGRDLLLVPQSALFRQDGGWAAFRVTDGVARIVAVSVGHQSEGQAEITDGLAVGDRVVLYPAASLTDGIRVVARAPG